MPSHEPDPPTDRISQVDAVAGATQDGGVSVGTPRVTEGLLRLLVESVRDYAIFALDTTGHILSWNAGAERLKGYSANEIIGSHFSIFYPQELIAARFPHYELEVAAREGRYEDEGWRVRKDGTRFWANVIITALRDESGALVGFAKVTRDLSERRASQERAVADARRIAEVEASNRTRSEFLASLSHELRTPINATLGYIGLLDVGIGGALTEQQREYLMRVRRSQEHLLHIINDLLNYSRVEAGHVAYERVPVALDDVVAAVLPMVEPQAVTKGLTMVSSPCDPTLIALADRVKVEQIALNLLWNAVKFTPAGGRVDIECTHDGECVSISVRDTGPGIALEHQTEIFEPFVQLGRSLASAHEGTGLGLAISRDLARAMGGDVTVVSRLGEGSTFTLSLPIVKR